MNEMEIAEMDASTLIDAYRHGWVSPRFPVAPCVDGQDSD